MKRSILMLVAAVSFSLTQAQSVNFGLKAGVNLANATGSDAEGSSMRVSFNAGALAQISLNDMLSVQPEVYYSDQGAKVKFDNGLGGTVTGTQKLGYINVPVLVKYTTSSGFFVQTGPQIGFLLSAKASAAGQSSDEKSFFKSTDFSWAFGAGFLTSMNIGIDARYNLGLSNIENTGNSGGTGTIKNGVIQIGVFYLFGEPKKK
ncbi:MAG TPA: porin family protein [Puia sp.]|nr:porin family protein [Puia sp.]